MDGRHLLLGAALLRWDPFEDNQRSLRVESRPPAPGQRQRRRPAHERKKIRVTCHMTVLGARRAATSASGPSVSTGRALQAESDDLERLVLRFLSGPLMERLSSWPSWISARVRSHSQLGPEGQMGHLIANALARPFSISSFQLADLGEKADYYLRDQPKPSRPSPVGN